MSRIRQPMGRAVLASVTLLMPALAGGQQTVTTLVGMVRDSSAHAVPGVEVRIGNGDLATRTSDGGGFRIEHVPVGRTTVLVRRLGFMPTQTEVTLRAGHIDSLVISLATTAASLPGVLVEDDAMTRSHKLLAGFWDRRSHGFGNFLTRQEIEDRNASNFVDLVRLVPSANIQTINGRPSIRFKRNMGTRDCPPQYWVDGMRIEQGSPDEFSPEDVEAIELYAGPSTIPVQFTPRPMSYTCGAIVIWTRLPGT